MQQEKPSHISPSPSFSSYSSSETLAQIAARVIDELRWDPHSVSDDETLLQPWENDNQALNDNKIQNDNDDDDFEFAFVSKDPTASPVSADDIFYNGQIKPIYPIFGQNDSVSSVSPITNNNAEIKRRRPALRKLMSEERETASCSSSTSEADDSAELEGAEEGTYCVWNPNSVGKTERKKSVSTNSVSKRWKLRNLVLGSHSEGKDQKVTFQVPSKRTNKVANEAAKVSSGDRNGGALVENDVKNRSVRTVKDGEETKRKSFLPYRQELVGLFAK